MFHNASYSRALGTVKSKKMSNWKWDVSYSVRIWNLLKNSLSISLCPSQCFCSWPSTGSCLIVLLAISSGIDPLHFSCFTIHLLKLVTRCLTSLWLVNVKFTIPSFLIMLSSVISSFFVVNVLLKTYLSPTVCTISPTFIYFRNKIVSHVASWVP